MFCFTDDAYLIMHLRLLCTNVTNVLMFVYLVHLVTFVFRVNDLNDHPLTFR